MTSRLDGLPRWSAHVVDRARTLLAEPVHRGGECWTVASISEPDRVRWVHTDAALTGRTGTVRFKHAHCTCPAGEKAPANDAIVRCSHVYRVLIAIGELDVP